MLRLKKAGLVVCEAVMVLIVIGMVLSGNVEAGTYKFVFKIPSQQWFFSDPSGVAVDSSGNVYVADSGNKRIQKFNSAGGFITKWGSSGSGDGQFSYPCGVAVDSSGNVYVADTSNQRIQKFNSSGGFITKWGSYGSGDGQFSNPYGVAVDSSGNVYVADSGNRRIQKFMLFNVADFDGDGRPISRFAGMGVGISSVRRMGVRSQGGGFPE